MTSQVNPVVVRIVEEPTPETGVADVLIGALGLVGFVVIAAFAVGILAGGVFILLRSRRTRRQREEGAFSPSPLTR